ncbi:MAG: NADP-dependent isocitrate dehydrogenase, partial [Pseudoalteromonas sp.]
KELNEAQGPAMAVGGYFQLNDDKAYKAMRPSATYNDILAKLV